MAGKRQHFLPRLLTSGFASRWTTKGTYTHVFQRTGEPREENIINVGAEGYFYGRESPTDDTLTQLECESFGPLVNQIRRTGAIPSDAGSQVAEFVASLVIRTRNLREVLMDVGAAIGSGIYAQFSDPNRAKRMFRQYIDEHPEAVLEPVLRRYGVTRIASVPKNRRLQILNCAMALLERPQTLAEAGAAADYARAQVLTGEAVRSAHLNALERDVIGSGRAAQLSAFRWSVVLTDPGTLILGDVGPIRFEFNEQRYDMLVEAMALPHLVLLPVSDCYLIVGGATEEFAIDDFEGINRAAAALSYEFFISSRDSPRERAYVEHLGLKARSVWKTAAHGLDAELDLTRIEGDVQARTGGQRNRPAKMTAPKVIAEPRDLLGSLHGAVEHARTRIASSTPVYFNWHRKGWIKRKMTIDNIKYEIVASGASPARGMVTFDCLLEQSDEFASKGQAVAAATAFGPVRSATGYEEQPSRGRVIYVVRNKRWVIDAREYRFAHGAEESWMPVPINEPDSWPTVLLLLF